MTKEEIEAKLRELRYHKETYRNFVSPEEVAEGYTIESIEEDQKFYRDLLWRYPSN